MSNLITRSFFDHPTFMDPFELLGSPLKQMARMDISSDLNYEVYKENNQFVAVFNMPGHSGMDDIHADVDKETRVLKVSSKKVDEKREEKEGRIYYHRGESQRSYAIRLPEDLNLESVSAKCENGQLKVAFDVKTEAEVENETKLSINIEPSDRKA